MLDIRQEILKSIRTKRFKAVIKADSKGILAGTGDAAAVLKELGLDFRFLLGDGDEVDIGSVVCEVEGCPEEISKAEEIVIGRMAKVSGIASAAKKALEYAGGKCRIIAGAWKKMPQEMKRKIQNAVRTGGASTRLIEDDFIYLDKNYVRMHNGIKGALEAVSDIDYKKVIQIKGETGSVYDEVIEAIKYKADVVMIDTGKIEDLLEGKMAVAHSPENKHVEIGFASEVKIADIPKYIEIGVDYLCIGKQIIDAPLLDMKLDVITIKEDV